MSPEMSSPKKRKLEEFASDISTGVSQNGLGVGETLALLKQGESTVEDESNRATSSPLADPIKEPQTQGKYVDKKPSDWNVIDRKRTKRKKAENGGGKIKYPELTFNGQLDKPIKLGELQNLIFYTLVDGVGPKWVAFRFPGHVKKVVCLMVPGLEMSMFKPLSSNSEQSTKGPEPSEIQNQKDQSDDAFAEETSGNPVSISSDTLDDPLKPLATAFGQIWPVKAPGDTKYNKLHSPIQAILVSPLPQSQEEKKAKGPRPVKESNSFHATRTLVTEFLLSPDELREAEYPLHPASIESPEDLIIEKARRETLGQTAINGWIDTPTVSSAKENGTPSKVSANGPTAGRKVFAIDCEMVLTEDDVSSLARISVVDWSGKTVLDELVKPSLPIKNYFTAYSGMTKEILDPVTTTLADVQKKLLELIAPDAILLGHSLESDLRAIKLSHPFIVDTSLLYPHPRGPPLRSSLKFLTQKYLSREIQKAGANGHDSVEDAIAVLDLVKLKCEKGPKWGTSEMNGETIFRRISRAKDRSGNVRTTAIVDYGTPERGFGKDATYAIGCKSDEEVVEGVKRAVNGDPDGKLISGGGVDFVWARLRELESLRGWCNNNREYNNVDALHSKLAKDSTTTSTTTTTSTISSTDTVSETTITTTTTTVDKNTSTPNPTNSTTDTTLSNTLSQTTNSILEIYNCLPPTTLFIVYSGTGDPRDVGRYQAMQRQFKKEYKVKKWDDLSVRWTDVEEQGLKRAVEQARQGIAFMDVK